MKKLPILLALLAIALFSCGTSAPDDVCFYHPSSGKEEGTLNSSGGWSDAVNYGKYVVNAAIYHKLTALTFGPFIMPEAYDLDPDFSYEVLVAAERAWDWAVQNPDVPFQNPEDVVTGEYGDEAFSDDFYWAAAELFTSTGKEHYQEALARYDQPYIHQITKSWKFYIRNKGFHILLINSEQKEELSIKHLALSDELLAKLESIPYRISIDHFEWGSNSDVLNQAMILCIAHHLSRDQKYFDGALRNPLWMWNPVMLPTRFA